MSPVTASDPSSDAQYHALASTLLARIEAQVDRWLQDDVVDIDAARTGGLLELSFSNGSKIVVNTQPPLHELWLASRRGGYHFKFVDGRWLDTKDGKEFFARLSEEASHHGGKPLTLSAACRRTSVVGDGPDRAPSSEVLGGIGYPGGYPRRT